MRGVALLIIVFGSLPLILAQPFLGTLMWAWVSYFNPHRLTWGVGSGIPFAQVVALVTIVAWLLSRETKAMPRNALVILMVMFVVWVSFTSAFALVPEAAYGKWQHFVKVIFMSYVTFHLIKSKERIMILLWVIVCSVGVYGFKGGIFVLLTGGQQTVFGPDGSAFGANNSVGVALAMILPQMRCLQVQTKSRLIYWGLMAAMFFTGIAVLATYSRGAALALAGMLGFLWLKSRYKVFTGVTAALAIVVALNVMPEKWFDRIESIQNYEEDWSSMERIKMWRYGINVATARPVTGGGFGVFPATNLYPNFGLSLCGPEWPTLPPTTNCVIKARTSHSIYFDALGEHGAVGLGLFLLLGMTGLWTAQRINAHSANRPDLTWARDFAAAAQTSMAAFAVGGLFVNMTYFDLYYHILVMLAATQVVVARELAASKPEVRPAPAQLGEARALGGD